MAYKLITCMTIRHLQIGEFEFKNHVCAIEDEAAMERFEKLAKGLPESLTNTLVVADDKEHLAAELVKAQAEIRALRASVAKEDGSVKELVKAGTAANAEASAAALATGAGPAKTVQGLTSTAEVKQPVAGVNGGV